MVNRIRPLAANQDGFASIVIAIVLVLVLSITTVGFATLMRNETNSATDKHLSSQAYYAAETGINDATKALDEGFSDQKKECDNYIATQPGITDSGADNFSDTSIGGPDSGISYSCLLIDPSPAVLKYKNVSNKQSKVIHITGASKSDGVGSEVIGSLTFKWGAGQGFVTDGKHTFQPASKWTFADVMRIALTPFDPAGNSRDSLQQNTYTAFLYPSDKAGGGNYNPGSIGINSGAIVDSNCNATGCSVTIDGLTASDYYLDLRGIYRNDTDLSITAQNGNIRIRNAQTVVDSTGKAQDVLRRLQVRIASESTSTHSIAPVESTGGICKQLKLVPNPPPPNGSISSNDCYNH